MEKFKLQLEARDGQKKPNQLRRAGKIPGTLYGPGVESKNVQVDAKEFSRLPAAAYSHIVELQGKEGTVPAIIRAVQRDHRNNEVLNLEFYRVAADRKLTVTVPLKIIGSSPAIQAGGLLVENFYEAEVECLPGDIPDFIEVDLAHIKEVEHGIHFSDLKPGKSVTILNPPDEIVVTVKAPKGGGTAAAAAEAEPAAAAAS